MYVFIDVNPAELSITNGSGNVYEYHESQSIAHSHPSYPLEDHAHSSYPTEEQSYIPESQTCTPEQQFPPVYAPVPMYSQQNMVSSELPSICTVQDGVNHPDPSYYQTVPSLDQGSHHNTG